MTHTPGPWKPARLWSTHRFDVIQEDGDRICEEANEANAHLIAAAPELLEALEDLLAWAVHVHDPRVQSQINYAGMDEARAAIAKAKGEA